MRYFPPHPLQPEGPGRFIAFDHITFLVGNARQYVLQSIMEFVSLVTVLLQQSSTTVLLYWAVLLLASGFVRFSCEGCEMLAPPSPPSPPSPSL